MKSLFSLASRGQRTAVVTLAVSAFLFGNQCLAASKPVSPGAAVTPPDATTLRIGIGIQPDTLEPSQVTNSAVASLLGHVLETLVTTDDNGRIAPQLATSWDISPDGLQFTFHLASGVTFQDGATLDANAVVWNANRLLGRIEAVSDCPAAAELAAIASVQALDKATVRYQLKHTVPNFLATLSWVAYGILSPQSLNRSENKLFNIQHPIGTGPFIFDALTPTQLQLSRFDGYHGERPYYSKLVFNLVSSAADREAMLAANQVDLVVLPSAQQISKYARDPRFAVLGKPGSRTIFLNLNNQKAPFNDVRVRRAVSQAIDRQALVDQVLQGAATLMDAPVGPGLFGYCSVGSYDYDPAAAKALLAQAGVAPGTQLRLITPHGRYLEDEAVSQRIATYLREVGFAVTVEPLEWPAMMGELFRPPAQVTVDIHLFGWAPTFPDAGWQLPLLYSSAKWPPRGPASSFYKNVDVDKLLDAAALETNPVARSRQFCDAEKLIWADVPAVFLWVQNFEVVARSGVTNITLLPNEKISVAFAKPLPGAPAKAASAAQATGGGN